MEYQLIRSNRRTLAVQVDPRGKVIVRCPKRMPVAAVERFLRSKAAWIQQKRGLCLAQPQLPPLTQEELAALKKDALPIMKAKAERYGRQLGLNFGRVTLRAQRTRWGSCSAKGNLNFNCLLLLAPEAVQDYVVLHELCHLREMNHSPAFWAGVEAAMPDYRTHKKWLKEKGPALLARLPE